MTSFSELHITLNIFGSKPYMARVSQFPYILHVPYLRTHAPYLRTHAPYLRTHAPYLRTHVPYLRTHVPYHAYPVDRTRTFSQTVPGKSSQ